VEREGLLRKEGRFVDGKIRKYNITTSLGAEILDQARRTAYELFKEIKD
jgi:PadR family transcriptional regulator PadR